MGTPDHQSDGESGSPSLQGGGRGVGHDDLFDLLAGLVRQSLVIVEHGGVAARYRLLDTVREYAAERLVIAGEQREAELRRHTWALALASRAAPLLNGPEQDEWLGRLDAEHDNLRAALRWALDRNERSALQLAGSLSPFWEIRGHLSEGRRWLTSALASNPAATADAQAPAVAGAGNLARMQGDFAAARALYLESLAIERERSDPGATAQALNNLGIVALFSGDFADARTHLEQSLSLRRSIGDTSGAARTLNNLGLLAREQGDILQARALYEQSIALAREAGDLRAVAGLLLNLGTIARDQGDAAAARSLFEESLAIFRERGDKASVSAVLNNLAVVATEQGDFGGATSLHHESLALKQELGDRAGIAHSLEELATLAAGRGAVGRAARLFASADALRQAIGTPLAPVERERHDLHLTDIRRVLGDVAFDATWREGAAMPAEQAVSHALAGMPVESER